MKRAVLALALLLPAFVARADDPNEYTARIGLIEPGGFIIFFNSQGPLSYQTISPNELPADAVRTGNVWCKICQHGVTLPVSDATGMRGTNVSGAAGNGSFKKAFDRLHEEHPDLRGVYDVKIDLQRVSILGIYRRVCTVILAKGFR